MKYKKLKLKFINLFNFFIKFNIIFTILYIRTCLKSCLHGRYYFTFYYCINNVITICWHDTICIPDFYNIKIIFSVIMIYKIYIDIENQYNKIKKIFIYNKYYLKNIYINKFILNHLLNY